MPCGDRVGVWRACRQEVRHKEYHTVHWEIPQKVGVKRSQRADEPNNAGASGQYVNAGADRTVNTASGSDANRDLHLDRIREIDVVAHACVWQRAQSGVVELG